MQRPPKLEVAHAARYVPVDGQLEPTVGSIYTVRFRNRTSPLWRLLGHGGVYECCKGKEGSNAKVDDRASNDACAIVAKHYLASMMD
ncbi:hypothetical protein RvY_14896 [Ramazzottius varieornatus]|uniref:Uncharacterized protein n=1 Tax=Ramazzottius varieornatus TaxID=947166 RepID=A0A1D1VXU3_RAMVA|nr:hypothetical protein RvY_14896 [Ramazzottius varieornatus]